MRRCWETFGCKEIACSGYNTERVQCWLVSGSHCREMINGRFLEKMEMCLECDVFKENINSAAMQETFQEIGRQFKEIRKTVDLNDGELRTMSMELAISLSEVFDALRKISAGDPDVSIPEQSDIELISLLKRFVNLTAKNIGEIVDQCHEFAFCLAAHFEVLHQISKGDLSVRVEDISQLDIFQSLRKLTNEMIESIAKEISKRRQVEKALKLNEERFRTLLKLEKMKMGSEQELAQFSLGEGVRLTGSTIGSLLFVNEEKNGADLCLWSNGAAKICSDQRMVHSFLDKTGIWGESIRSRKPFIRNDFQNTPYRKGYPETHVPITRYMSIPVFDESKILAAVGVQIRKIPIMNSMSCSLLY